MHRFRYDKKHDYANILVNWTDAWNDLSFLALLQMVYNYNMIL